MNDLAPFARSVWLLLDLLDIKSQLNWRPINRKRALDACVDNLRISLASVRQTLTAPPLSQPSQVLLELAIHAIHGYGDNGYSIAMVIDFERGQLRDVVYDDALVIWIAELLVETVRRAAAPDQAVWTQVIANLEAAVERVDQFDTSISRWEVLDHQPFTEVILLELIDGVQLFAPPLAHAHALDTFLKREVLAVVEGGTAPWLWQMPRIRRLLLTVREQLTGVHTAISAGLAYRNAQRVGETAPRCYASLTWREHR